MTGLRDAVASLGIALAALGLGFVAFPRAAGALPLPRVAVVVLGLFALVEGARSLQSRRRTPVDGAEFPDPERRRSTPIPGDEFDDRVATLARRGRRSWADGEHGRLRRRLRASAVEAAAHRWRLGTDDARDRVEAGEWTDDPAAAWFLGGADAPAPPWRVRARAAIAAGSAFAFYASRAADAVVALREAT